MSKVASCPLGSDSAAFAFQVVSDLRFSAEEKR